MDTKVPRMEMKAATGRAATALFTVAMVAQLLVAAGAAATDCTRRCGNISIPYPFGVEPGCYIEPGFNLTCDPSRQPPKLFLSDGTTQVLGIDLRDGTVRINGSVAYFPGNNPGANNGTSPKGAKPGTNGTWWSGTAIGKDGPYSLARGRNKLLAVGCNIQVVLSGDSDDDSDSAACFAVCPPFMVDGTPFSTAQTNCSHNLGCCQTEIVAGLSSYEVQVVDIYREKGPSSDTIACIVDSESPIDPSKLGNSPGATLPAVLDWSVKRTACNGSGFSNSCRSSNSSCVNVTLPQQGHLCHCAQGYQGNPYIPNGCKGNLNQSSGFSIPF